MRSGALAWIAVLALVQSAAAQPAPSDAAPAAPVWLARPTGDDLAKVYPPGALRDGVSGTVRIQCVFAASGSLEDCKVAAEDPAGAGFGAAGLALMPIFKAEKLAKDGRPIAGAPLTVPMRFVLPPPEAANLDWTQRPSATDFERVYPAKALVQEKSGLAVLKCAVGKTGELVGCAVQSEQPAGYGFGEAALKLAPKFRTSPRTRDGRSIEGASLELPIPFRIN